MLTGTTGDWVRFLAVAAGYVLAFGLARRFVPFSLDSPWFVILAMICFLGLVFVAQPIWMPTMPRPLRTLRRWETGGGVYRSLGVPLYGTLLRRTPLRLFNRDVYLRRGTANSERVGAELEAAEASHFWAAALVLPYMVYVVFQRRWGALCFVSVAQAFVNVYPVMHLRLTRHRLERLAARMGANGAGRDRSRNPHLSFSK